MFTTRSLKLERIDTGDYTPEEYDRFLSRHSARQSVCRRPARFAENASTGNRKSENLPKFSVLDVGAGSGELLRDVGKFARRKNKRVAKLFGLGIKRAFGKCDFGRIEKLR